MNGSAIELQAFTKRFGGRAAVDRLTLNVPEGSVFGFLGVNGAGKTTTIRAIVGHLHATSGAVVTLGVDPWRMNETERRRLAYVSENMALPAWMSPRQAVRFCAAQTPKWDTELAKKLLVGFGPEAGKPYRDLSKGQRRRACLMTALCQGADLLVLDEPAAGLDVEARRNLLEEILEIACDGGRTVFFSSHILTDLERVVDHVAMIDNGQLSLSGDLETLKACVRQLELPGQVDREAIAGHFTVLRHEAGAHRTLAVVRDFAPEKLAALCAALNLDGDPSHTGFSLEDLFLEIRRSTSATATREPARA